MNTVFIAIRTLHVLLAAIWFGASFVTALFLGPAVAAAGPGGGAVMSGFMKRGFDKVMASIGGITLVSGIWLYWRMTQGFDASIMSSKIGMVFGLGGLVGIAGGIVGGSVVGRTSKAMFELGNKMSQMPDGPEKAAAAQTAIALRARIGTGSKVLLALLTTAMLLMAVARFVR